jgi:mutator protein MutT
MAERFVTRTAVFMVVVNDDNKILLQQRAGTGYLDGYWDFPSGHVEPDEALRDAASRELLEEVGLTTAAEDLNLIHIDQYFLDRNYINFTFKAKKWQGTPAIGEPDKVSAIDWFALDELPTQCVNVVRATVQAGLSDELTYSVTDKESYVTLMGEPLPIIGV